ncbi:MAG: 3-keto-5-aminohexanoate cleavage protein [Xenococcus sp. (in: cyanobacteria)]
MKRRELVKAVAAAGTTLAATRAMAGPATSGLRSNFSFKKEETPVILEVAINGSTTKKVNSTAPETPTEIAAEAIDCLDAGATIVHAHTNKPMEDPDAAAQVYIEAFKPVREKHPHAILYPTANFDPAVNHKNRTSWRPEIQSGHYRKLAESGAANMVLFDTGVVPISVYDENGLPGPADKFWWYGFWPGDDKIVLDLCNELGTGASISVFEPGWMKNVVAMARAGTLPRGAKVIMYFADYDWAGMAPPIPEALQLYLHMIEGLDLKWSVGMVGGDIMDTPLARMALERGGNFRVGLEDWWLGPSNLEQLKRAKELIDKVGRPIVSGAEAIEYLDIPFAATRPKA